KIAIEPKAAPEARLKTVPAEKRTARSWRIDTERSIRISRSDSVEFLLIITLTQGAGLDCADAPIAVRSGGYGRGGEGASLHRLRHLLGRCRSRCRVLAYVLSRQALAGAG